jgi:rod shape-determining protein MreC
MNGKDLQSIGLALVLVGIIISPVFSYLGKGPLANLSSTLFLIEKSPESNQSLTELEAQITQLETEVSSLLYLAQENEKLKQLLNITPEDYTVVQAQVLAEDPILLANSVIINKGEDQGIQTGQAVIYLGTLIGTVTNTTETTATIRLLQDINTSIAAQIPREGKEPIKGVVRPEFGLEITLDLVPNTVPIEIGEAVFTSGIDDLPAGILIGNITDIQEGELYQTIRLDRKIDPNAISQVFVLTQ